MDNLRKEEKELLDKINSEICEIENIKDAKKQLAFFAGMIVGLGNLSRTLSERLATIEEYLAWKRNPTLPKEKL